MKHIRLFEDYSEEELRDLQDTLHDIGHKTKFVQGEDFGFGDGFKEPRNMGYYPRINQEMLRLLIKSGEIIRDPTWNYETYKFKTPQKWGIPNDSLNPKIHHVYGNEWILEFLNIPDGIKDTTFNNVIKKLGEIRI